jgi:hypothetical protein
MKGSALGGCVSGWAEPFSTAPSRSAMRRETQIKPSMFPVSAQKERGPASSLEDHSAGPPAPHLG